MPNIDEYGFNYKQVSSAFRIGKIGRLSGQIYTLNKYNLVATLDMENIEFEQDGDRFVVYDSNGIRVANISIYDMDDWAIKRHGEGVEEHVFSVKKDGVSCKMLVEGFHITESAC